MNVYLTEPAERYLKDIFLYYRFRASETVAQKIIDRILKRIESLEKLAMRDRIELNLTSKY